jgi:hypothetical protein
VKRQAFDFLSEPREESQQRISMTVDHFRWLLMWHGAFVRELMAIEVDRDGLAAANRRTKMMNRQRKAFLAHKRMLRPLRRLSDPSPRRPVEPET